jgi:hypothetical protein
VQRIIKVLGCIAAIVLAVVVLARSHSSNEALLCWAAIALAVGVLVEAAVP